MSNKNLLDTLMYLFERLSQEKGISPAEPAFTTPDEVEIGLLDAGFDKSEVERLLDWLESFNVKVQDKSELTRINQSKGFRVFHDKEYKNIDPQAINYLLKLKQTGKLTPHAFEFIINQIIKLDVNGISLEQVKWILSMTKLNHEGPEQMLELIIQDVLDERNHKNHTPVLH